MKHFKIPGTFQLLQDFSLNLRFFTVFLQATFFVRRKPMQGKMKYILPLEWLSVFSIRAM